MNHNNRLQKLRQVFSGKEIDAILISQPENRYYLSGFNGSSGYLLITSQNTVLVTDSRYTEQARTQAPDYDIIQMQNNMTDWLPCLTTELNVRTLGFEAGDITFTLYRRLADALKPANLILTPVDGLVESLRAVKEPEEIGFITKAAEMTDRAMEHIEELIHPGISEKEVAWGIEKFLRERGSQPLPFEVIVASGPNAALPHAKPSPRTICTGEPVVIDIGARYRGYISDLSRTFCVGVPDDTFKKVYDAVLGAQLAALAIMREGMTGDGADSLARTVIEQTGYGEAFGHALGHGVGLASHEPPRLGPKSADILTSGMVFSVEPGIYLSGWGGVRIEDLVTIENGNVNVISKARKVVA